MSAKVAAVLVLRADGAALLQHRDDKPNLRHPGMWVPPGGHADAGESMEDCARRELREETEYEARDLQLLEAFVHSDPGWPDVEMAIFWTRDDGRQQVRCHEGQALEFVTRAAADGLPIPPHLLAAWDKALAVAATHRPEHR